MDDVGFFFVGSRAGLCGENCQTLRPVFRVCAGAGRNPEAQLHAPRGQRIVGGRGVRGRAVCRALGCGSRKGSLPAPLLRLLVFGAEHARRHRLKLLKHADKLRVAGVADLKRDLLDIPRAVVDQLFARAIRT